MDGQLCVLVDENDNVLGTEEKLLTHWKGLLHRAFSAFVFNDRNELLLQKRADGKYHSAGLWTNTCCSHPQPNETVVAAGERRLMEELNFTTSLQPVFSFIYKAELENNLTEHELDHVLIGRYNDIPAANEEEVSECRFVSLEKLKAEIALHPDQFTAWLKIILENHLDKLQQALE
jgi:isopentenyl-diphosphate delta-isomerase